MLGLAQRALGSLYGHDLRDTGQGICAICVREAGVALAETRAEYLIRRPRVRRSPWVSKRGESRVMAMLTRLAKRAAFHATVAIGGFQRRAGGRFPRYASFCRRAAGYVAYAMAGEPFRAVTASPPSGAPAVQVPGTALGRASHLEVAGAHVICIEEPVGPINAGFFHLRGWLTSERTLPDIRSVVNGKPFPLCRYARPDVQGDYPDRQTTGFSVFVRLGEIPNPEYVTIEILAGADRLIQQIEDATARET